jgi:hypothetical protein
MTERHDAEPVHPVWGYPFPAQQDETLGRILDP